MSITITAQEEPKQLGLALKMKFIKATPNATNQKLSINDTKKTFESLSLRPSQILPAESNTTHLCQK